MRTERRQRFESTFSVLIIEHKNHNIKNNHSKNCVINYKSISMKYNKEALRSINYVHTQFAKMDSESKTRSATASIVIYFGETVTRMIFTRVFFGLDNIKTELFEPI